MGPTKGVRSGGSACGPRPDATRNRSAGDPGRPLSGQRAGRFNHHISPTPAAPPQLRARTSSGGGGGCIPGLWRRRREVSGSGLWRRELSGSGHQRQDLSDSGLQRWELGGSGLRSRWRRRRRRRRRRHQEPSAGSRRRAQRPRVPTKAARRLQARTGGSLTVHPLHEDGCRRAAATVLRSAELSAGSQKTAVESLIKTSKSPSMSKCRRSSVGRTGGDSPGISPARFLRRRPCC